MYRYVPVANSKFNKLEDLITLLLLWYNNSKIINKLQWYDWKGKGVYNLDICSTNLG